MRAAFNLEDLDALRRSAVGVLYAGVAAVTTVVLVTRSARQRLLAAWPGPALLAGAFLVTAIPLAQLLPDWNAWRAWVPTLAFGLALGWLLALVHPGLAVAFAGVRLLALLFAPPAKPIAMPHPPATASHMSYLRLARLQRIVASAHDALTEAHPQLAKGARVRYWNLPRFAEVGFLEATAPRVWYRDSTLSWRSFGGHAGLFQELDVLIEFVDFAADPAAVIDPPVVDAFVRGARAQLDGQPRLADSLYAVAIALTRSRGSMLASLWENRASSNLALGNIDSTAVFIERSREITGENADYWAVIARVRGARGDRAGAERAYARLLALKPDHPDAPEIARLLGIFAPPQP